VKRRERVSDISILSQEYKTSAELAERVNQALIVLKKAHMELPGWEAIGEEELAMSKEWMLGVLTTLATQLETRSGHQASEGIVLPGPLVTRLRAERRSDMTYYLEELRLTASHLREGVSSLGMEDLTVFEQIATAADAETSTVFRRLMRR